MVDLDALHDALTDADINVKSRPLEVYGVQSIVVRPHRSTEIEVYEDGDVEVSVNGTCLVGPRFFRAIDIIRRHIEGGS